MSVRELCRLNDIPVNSQSGVIRIAREEGWVRLREELQSRSTEKTMDLLADRDARRNLRVAEVTDDAIDMVGEMINQTRGRLKTKRRIVVGRTKEGEDIVEYEPELVVAPKDLGKLLTGLKELGGRTAPSTERPNGGGVDIHVPAGSDFAILSRYVDRVRETGGPIDDDPAGSEAPATGTPPPLALQSGAPGPSEDLHP